MKYTKKASDHINSIESADKRDEFINMLNRAANRLARKYGYGCATKIDIRKDSKVRVGKTVSFGWAKDSTGNMFQGLMLISVMEKAFIMCMLSLKSKSESKTFG